MADYETLEASVEGSRPIEVYEFAIGGDSYLYTSYENTVTVGINTYAPIAIRRSNIPQGPEERNRALEVRVPHDNPFAELYKFIVPGQRASLTITRVQRDETPTFDTQIVIFKGFVRSVLFPKEGTEAIIAVMPIESALARQLPRFTFQGLCNYMLYDTDCGVNQASFQHTGTVTAVDGNTITVSGASGFSDDYFTSGYIKPTSLNDFRMIRSKSGDVLTVLLPFPESIVGQTVDLFAGCDHKIDGDCQNKFNNVINHGGFPFVPTKNPFETGIE